jgi:glycosyltransferase involved in cell wall biosynthesis
LADGPRILIDATAVPAERAGVGRYVDQLIAAMAAEGADLTIVCQQRDADIYPRLAPASRVITAPSRTASKAYRFAWEQLGLPVLIRKLKVEVLHSPHYTMPLASPVPVVVTLHDATFFSDRALHLGVKGRFFRSWIKLSLRRAAVCVVPSAATADELVRFAGARRDTMVVAHHGVDSRQFHLPDADQLRSLRRQLNIDGDWIAFLGTLEPRKNVPELIRGFCSAGRRRLQRHPAESMPTLVLAGGQGWDDEVEPALAAVPSDLRVIRAGYLPIELLPALLGGAQLVAYPTLGEGFGLPVLEAMACGAAVLTTRRLSLPEVGGDAVAYTDVDASSIADAIELLLDDPSARATLGAAAVRRAAEFSWQAAAHTHLAAFRQVATSVDAR